MSETMLQSPILEHGLGIMVSAGAFEFLIQKTRHGLIMEEIYFSDRSSVFDRH